MSPEVYGFLKVGNVVARSAFDNEVTSNFLIFTKLTSAQPASQHLHRTQVLRAALWRSNPLLLGDCFVPRSDTAFTGISGQKRIATPPHLPWRAVPGKNKSGGSQ